MATEQEYDDILHYKTSSSKYRPGLSENEKRNIRAIYYTNSDIID